MSRHDARAVANALINLSKKAGNLLTPMQILKLVYLCHGWMLGLYSKPLITQPVKAWRYGPVIEDVYHSLKVYRADEVDKSIVLGDVACDFDQREQRLIDEVYKAYSDWSGIELSNLTHQPGSPWSVTVDAHGLDAVISNDLIEDYYKRLANNKK